MDMSDAYKALLPLFLLAVLLTGCGSRVVPLVPETASPYDTAEVPPAPTPTPLLSPPPRVSASPRVVTPTPPVTTPASRTSGARLPAGRHYPSQLAQDWEEQNAAENAAETAARDETYTVRAGDCLWTIARDHCGSGANWRRLWEANRDAVEDPSLVLIGQVLALPAETG